VNCSISSERPADGADGEAAADDLRERGEVGFDAELALGALEAADAEAGDHPSSKTSNEPFSSQRSRSVSWKPSTGSTMP